MVSRLLKYEMVEEKAESEQPTPTNVIDLVSVLQESLRRSVGTKKRLVSKLGQPDIGETLHRMGRHYTAPSSVVCLPGGQPFGSGELEPEPTVYHVQSGLVIRASQLTNLLVATGIFGGSVFCFIVSLLVWEFGALAPWFFWLIPTVGALGVAVGILLNILESTRKS